MKRSIRCSAAVGVALIVPILDGCSSSAASIDHPHGCDVFHEGPAVLVAPSAGPTPAAYSATLGEPFQINVSLASSPDRAVADNRRVLQFLWFKPTPDGKALTGFRASKIGTSTVSVQRRASPGQPATTLRLIVTVPCHEHQG